MFREYGMGSFRDLLVQLSRDPAMLMWLDNQDNHMESINENYGREILELFSMGVGNYTEDDIKECSRAFTGWRVVNPDYMSIKMRNNTARPYGYIAWQFEYDDEDHDHEDKTFLGETGDFNGEDVVDIICKQPATARFIARHLYHFFVADELPVPQWPHFDPIDPEAIEIMAQAYFDSGYDISAMLRAMFNSDFFKSEASRFAQDQESRRDGRRYAATRRTRSTCHRQTPTPPPERARRWARACSILPALRDGREAASGSTPARTCSGSTSPAVCSTIADKPGIRAMIDRIAEQAQVDSRCRQSRS